MLNLANSLLYFNLTGIPLYCLSRFRKSKFLIFLNPCFYLLIGAYLYLTLSCVLAHRYLEVYSYIPIFEFSDKSIQVTDLLCNWFTFVFFICYIISVDRQIIPVPFTPKILSYQISLYFTFIVSVLLLIITIAHGPSLLGASNRVEALGMFADLSDQYRLGALINILLGSVAVIVWRTKKFRWYLVLLIPIFLELLSKGRSVSLKCIIFAYINYVVISKKPRILGIFLICFGLVATKFFRVDNISFDNLNELVRQTFSELILTRTTTTIVYDNFIQEGYLDTYFLQSIFEIFPGSLLKMLGLEPAPPYSVVLEEYYREQTGIGLAGNIVSEALFYGGMTFAILSPIIIGGFFLSLGKLKIYRTFPGFIFYCFLISSLQKIIRSSFYDNVLVLVYLMFSYLIWITVLENNKVLFVNLKKKYNEIILPYTFNK